MTYANLYAIFYNFCDFSPYHLSFRVIYMVSAEDVDLTIHEDFDWFVRVSLVEKTIIHNA